jgi:DsbC/DsbD-like thiol-disulfide interchange protein
LKNFADRRGITYPLLSDPQSSVIKAFGILNTEVPPGTPFYGIPYPGTYIVDPNGRVVAKYFEADYVDRYMTSEILVREFGASAAAAQTETETKHLKVISAASTEHARVGQRIALTLDIEMKPNMHVYAPGVEGYIPIDWQISPSSVLQVHPVDFPKPKMLHLDAINETVPVYNGKFRLVRDITIGNAYLGMFVVQGALKYQACNDRECFIPQTVPLKWTFQVEMHDHDRPPAELQRKMQ